MQSKQDQTLIPSYRKSFPSTESLLLPMCSRTFSRQPSKAAAAQKPMNPVKDKEEWNDMNKTDALINVTHTHDSNFEI
ncbi:Uncharacterized protein TCM_011641 [Theobroma cacao]|uniref:Uncharacterized protein n=1 Tax=Theobroma cacao TaxID=3641 RepID=A0A061EBR4_THECC|nr:Uncharacterized protein TCM_011641 [Theobroma cacao]